MTLREQEIAERRDLEHRDKVLTFRQWCELNNFSVATGRRIINAGNGPTVLQLSPRRIGIRQSDNAAWQASRAR
jgi:predicted DNA-binding transcriptional regulator AlpA